MFLGVTGVVSSVINIEANLFLDQIHVQKRVEFHQFVQSLKRCRLVLELEGRIGRCRVVKNVEVGKVFFRSCLARDVLKNEM